MIDDLRNLNQDTESDFLRIGGKLMEFLQSAEGISSGLNSLTLAISGEHGRQASEVLARALERCREMETLALQWSRDLEALRAGADSVRGTFSGFRDFLSTYHVLDTLTRIETARLGAAGAKSASLTDDVKSLAGTMGSKMQHVREADARLDERIEHAVASLSDVDVLLKDLPLVITGVISSLALFSNQQVDALALSAQLASDSHLASSSIKDAVVSIQFHDITRQQVEHVIDALQRVSADSKSRGSTRSHEVTAVLALEASQLSDAEDKFTSSVGSLSRDLTNITASVREMTTNGRRLLEASGTDQGSFFVKMEQCLTAILNAVVGHDKAETAVRTAAGDLGVTLASMKEAAADIRAIDLQLFHMALNAGIRAAHLGASGETLNVLAGALQDLATKGRLRSDVIGDALDGMSSVITRLARQGGSASAPVRAAEDAVAGEMRATIADLHAWSESSFTRVTEITTLASRLCDDISAAQDAFTVGGLFTEVVTRCRGTLMQLAVEAGPPSADADRSGTTLGLEHLAGRYTMQAEREVHAAMTRAAGAKPSQGGTGGATRAAPRDTGEPRDDIELF